MRVGRYYPLLINGYKNNKFHRQPNSKHRVLFKELEKTVKQTADMVNEITRSTNKRRRKVISLSPTTQIHVVDLSWFACVNAHAQMA